MEEQILITQVDPKTFDFQNYTEQDNILISSSRLDTAFTASTDYIEYYAYDENLNLIYPTLPNIKAVQVNTFSVINGDTILYPDIDLENAGYSYGTFFSTYNFYRRLLGSSIDLNYYISEISSDRTELRLKSNTIPSDLIISSSNDFIQRREVADYFVDFLLNFGYDQQVISNNIRLDTETEIEPSVLIKLYEPLPPQFQLKSSLWVVEEISDPQAYQVVFPTINFIPDDFQFIKGPNYSLQIQQETGASGQLYDLSGLVNTNMTSSYNQLQSILDKKSISINVDYTDYANFIHFSSAQTRLENFYYKVSLIQSASAQLPPTEGSGNTTENSSVYNNNFIALTAEIDAIIRSFDGYEYFLYYNSGSQYSYPKSTSTMPYILYPTGSQEVLTWIGSADDENPYYGGQALIASTYDNENPNWLYNSIPEYLRTDSNNRKYELFVDMVAQQYDDTWLYTKDLTNRFNNDNRLDYGISKDLVADAIKDFGIKLYSNNFNTDDLYTAFLGITPSGSTFPFPYMTGSYPAPSGFEYVNTEISASNDIVPLDNVNKSVYKRIYHNLPYLLKTKGTIAGLRALITSYGIPDTILRINEFGGRDRKEGRDWDYSQNQFNYAFHLDGTSYMESSFKINSAFQNVDTAPKALQFRFKTAGIPTSSLYQQIWVADTNASFITLEYTGSGMDSGSYSGSIPDNYNQYGTLKFYPDGLNGVTKTASISLPFFDGGWWSVIANVDYNNTETASLYSANRIGNQIGFSGSDSIEGYVWQYWGTADKSYFPSSSAFLIQGKSHVPLSGALQEVRYWDVPLELPLFYDYTMNPYSTQGNTINSTPDDLVFRAPLGTYLDTTGNTSIHPKVTGSWEITQSFIDNTSTYFFTGSFIENKEEIFLNQVPGGLKNAVTDKIQIVDTIIPSGSTLSPFISVQQQAYPSGSAPNINYLEVSFSPTDQVNDDIVAQIGNFTLGDYIGDPRQISESSYSYPQLDQLRDQYFTKYITSYDVNDFVRLIKFFDNSLFKMIADFTPARTSLSSGVVIKQNLLERNRQRPPQVSTAVTMSTYYTGSPSNPYSDVVALTQQDQTLSGSVRTLARDYNLGTDAYPQYAKISGSSIYVFDGGTGGVFEPFNNIANAPISESDDRKCLEWYFYTSSADLKDADGDIGYIAFEPTVVNNNTNTTMSINWNNYLGASNQDYLNYLISQSALGYSIQATVGNPGNDITYNVDKIVDSEEGWGIGTYGISEYGVSYTSSYLMFMTVLENNLQNSTVPFSNNEDLDVCFNILGLPYSGLTAAQVSASAFAFQYPGVVQDFTEYVQTSLGDGFPMGSSYTQSTSNTYGNGLLAIPRIDQREFYNGEFPNTINVKLPESCKPFFGQDDIPDYNFLIQWFNNNSFPEDNFLSPTNLPLAGNVWMWADTVGTMKTGVNNTLTINSSPVFCDNLGTLSTFNYTSSNGYKTAGQFTLVSSPYTSTFIIETGYFSTPGEGYKAGGTITVSQAELVSMGFVGATGPIEFNIDTENLNPTPSNKVKYIKMSDTDVNGIPIQPFIQESQYVIFNLTGASDYLNSIIEGYQTWYISNTTAQDDNIPSTTNAQLLIINQEPSSEAVTSFDSAFYDLTFSASGVFDYYATQSGEDPNVVIANGVTSSIPQGYFPPIPSYPTEEFFRGWASATFYQTNTNGGVSKISSGSGYYYDPFGYKNFSIGKIEIDNDAYIPYTASIIPWFMNATASTLQVLDNSSLVGGLGQTDLQLYTGSITQSSVELGLAFEIYTQATPTLASNITQLNLGPAPTPTISATCGLGLTTFGNLNNADRYITVLATSPTTPWTATVSYTDGNGWVYLSAYSGTGNAVIDVNVTDGVLPQNGAVTYTRAATVTITNLLNSFNTVTCYIEQLYKTLEFPGGGFEQITPNIEP